jgi:hypothetical protein
VIDKELLASAAQIEPVAATAVSDDKNDTFAKYKKKKPAAARAPQPAPQQLHRDHRRHADRDGDDGDDGDDGGDGDDDAGGDDPDIFVPDAQVRAEFGNITPMTLHRWDHNPELGFPPPIDIAGRKYRSRRMLEEFKKRALCAAIAAMSDPTLRRKQPEALSSQEVVRRKIKGVRQAHARRAQVRAAAAKRPRERD